MGQTAQASSAASDLIVGIARAAAQAPAILASIPVHRSYDRGWFGAKGIFEGLRAVEGGEQAIVTFAVAPHPATSDDGDEDAIFVTIGRAQIEGAMSWRFCGGDDGCDPDGHSSHALVASWEEQDLALATAGLALYLQRKCKTDWAIYRQPAAEKAGVQ